MASAPLHTSRPREEFQSRIQAIMDDKNRQRLSAYLYEEENRIKASSISARLDAIIPLGIHLGKRPWLDATRDDVIEVITTHRYRRGVHKARDPDSLPLRQLSKATRVQWKSHMLHFYKWLLDTEDTPPQFKRLPFKKNETTGDNARELALRPEEVRQLLSGARCARDRAIILCLIESGWRASEAAALRLDFMETKRLSNGRMGYWFTLCSSEPGLKTGPRSVAVPVIAAAESLEDWFAEHPRRTAEPPYLFVSLSNRNFGARMTGKSIAEVVARCARRAGMRHIHCHMTRHTSTSLKLAKGMNETAVRRLHGWSKHSTMLRHYEHCRPDFERMVLEVHGLEPTEPDLVDIIGSQACPLCGEPMSIKDGRCLECGALDSEAFQVAEARRNAEHALAYIAGQLQCTSEELMAEYEAENGASGAGDDVTKWALARWANRHAFGGGAVGQVFAGHSRQ